MFRFINDKNNVDKLSKVYSWTMDTTYETLAY